MLDFAQCVIVNIAGHIHQRITQIQELICIYAAVLPSEVSGNRTNHGILYEAGIQQVNNRLGIAADIHIAIATGATLNGIQGIKHIGELAMVIQAGNCHRLNKLLGNSINGGLRFILSSKQHLISNILAVLQRVLAVHDLVVIDLDNRVLIRSVHIIVIQELGTHEGFALELAFQLGIELLKHILVTKLSMEEVPAALDIRNTRLPVDIQQIHTLHGDITQAIKLVSIPDNLVNTGAGLQLLPHGL